MSSLVSRIAKDCVFYLDVGGSWVVWIGVFGRK